MWDSRTRRDSSISFLKEVLMLPMVMSRMPHFSVRSPDSFPFTTYVLQKVEHLYNPTWFGTPITDPFSLS